MNLLEEARDAAKAAKLDISIEVLNPQLNPFDDGEGLNLDNDSIYILRHKLPTDTILGKKDVDDYYVWSEVAAWRGRDNPPDVDVIEHGNFPTLAAALACALPKIVTERLEGWMDRLADDYEAKCLAEEKEIM